MTPAIADIDGDGKLDLVIKGNDQSPSCPSGFICAFNPIPQRVAVLLGTGNGTFSAPQIVVSFDIGNASIVFGLGDFNGDGRLDIAVAHWFTLSVFLGTGAGAFAAPFQNPLGIGGSDPSSLAVGDFNHDGKLDIVVNAYLKLGLGNGQFGASTSVDAAAHGDAAKVVDFNADGRLDLAIISSSANDVSIVLGRGDGTFHPSQIFAVGNSPRSLALADFDGDGRLDMTTGNHDGQDLSILLGRGDGTFNASHHFFVAPSNSRAGAIGDLNGDGFLDLIGVDGRRNSSAAPLHVLLGSGDGLFGTPHDLMDTSGDNASFRAVGLGDFNLDGKVDIAAVGVGYSGSKLYIYLGLGDGTFGPALNFSVGANPSALAIRNFNSDGVLDIAVANNGSNNISVRFGVGDGTFGPAAHYAVGTSPIAVLAGDFNHDGAVDLAVANSGSNDIAILLGTSNSTFVAAIGIPIPGSLSSLAIGDINGDGNLDLVAGKFSSNALSVALGRGDGTFLLSESFISRAAPYLTLGDFNGDGKLDLAGTDRYQDVVTLSLGMGDGTFLPSVDVVAGYYPVFLVPGDLNRDGKLDLVTLHEEDGRAAVLLNASIPTLPDVSPPLLSIDALYEGWTTFNRDILVSGLARDTALGDSGILSVTVNGVVANNGAVTGSGVAKWNLPVTLSVGENLLTVVASDGSSNQNKTMKQIRVWYELTPTVSIGNASVYEGNAGTRYAVFDLTLSFPLHNSSVIYSYSTVNGTATGGTFCLPGVDYKSRNSSFSFAPGTTSSSIFVEVCGDTVLEADETFFVNLTGASNATVVKSPGLGSILDDDDRVTSDFDGDGQSDIVIYRDGAWSILRSSDGMNTVLSLGNAAQDIPVLADYDGDGVTDLAIYHDGVWRIVRSSDDVTLTAGWGGPAFLPVPADYDGDGRADIAVFLNGVWSIQQSSGNGYRVLAHGGPGWIPVPADYDGDGKADLAVYLNGAWAIKRSSDNGTSLTGHGGTTWEPVPGDYDGDGKADIAVYMNGAWSILRSSDNGIMVVGHGGPDWVPVPADYDGDGKADIAVYHPAGAWSIKRSSDGTIQVIGHGGGPTDVPLN